MTLSPRSRGFVTVALATVIAAVAWSWPLAKNLTTHTLVREAGSSNAASGTFEGPGWDLILANDQDLSLWGASVNAKALLRGDLRSLLSQGQCYPMPKATALGEHMIELGVLAAPWMLATHDPVVAYNMTFLGALLVAACGMYLFLFRHTRSEAASIVGALAFAFATPRLGDLPYHPAVVGTHWIPWVLWAFDAIVDGGAWAAVLRFSVVLLLASLVGSYPMMDAGLVGGVYGVVRLLQQRRRGVASSSALARALVGAAPAALLAGALLMAYSAVQRDWTLAISADGKFLVYVADYLPGAIVSAGIVALFGLVPLLLLRGEEGRDAVVPVAAATLVAFAFATRIPVGGGQVFSLYESLARHVSLLASVRGPGKIGLAVGLGLQALGAIGWSRVFVRLAAPLRAGVAALLVLTVAVEVAPPSWLKTSLGSGAAMEIRAVAPTRPHLEVLAAALGDPRDRRAVLDLPTGRMVRAPLALLDAAWHDHPTSACYNSLVPPTMREVYALAARSHSERGIRELAAAGFGFVIERPRSSATGVAPTSFPPPARLLAFDPEIAVWGLPQADVVQSDARALALTISGGATRGATFAPEPPNEIDVEVTNGGSVMWAASRPLSPLVATVELLGSDGSVVFRSRARGVLPLALAAGATTTVQLVMPDAPAPGSYRANIRMEGIAQLEVAAVFRWGDEAH